VLAVHETYSSDSACGTQLFSRLFHKSARRPRFRALVARRFWRADTGCAGLEIYVREDGLEMPLRDGAAYARTGADASRLDREVARLVGLARGAVDVSPSVDERFAALELAA
jgi:hypothetical protein